MENQILAQETIPIEVPCIMVDVLWFEIKPNCMFESNANLFNTLMKWLNLYFTKSYCTYDRKGGNS